jgi:hypothetical protein
VTTHPDPWARYVILHIRSGPRFPDPVASPQIAADGRFDLSDEMWIEKLDTEFAANIQRACEPANYKVDNYVRDRHLYAFIRDVPKNEPREVGVVSRDEALIPLRTAVVLSRLVWPTSTGDRYCANIVPPAGTDPSILAVPIRGVCPDVFVGDDSRDWLSPENGLELRGLMPWVFPSKKMHDRVHHAFWNHEQTMRTYYLDVRWNLVVSGLEALITVEKNHLRQQFVRRVGRLAKEFTISLSDPELHDAYTLRSKLAHAEGFLFALHTVLPPSEHKPLHDKLETLLRVAVKKCLLDEVFGLRFADDSAVKEKWGS